MWLDYFKLVGAAFALLEKSPVANELKKISEEKIYEMVIQKTRKLEVESKLSAFTIAANAIETRQSQGNYHLVILNAASKTVTIKSFSRRRLEEASAEYAETEKISTINKDIQAVLVATNSIDALKKAYPNYFLDTRQFSLAIKRIQRLHENSNQ